MQFNSLEFALLVAVTWIAFHAVGGRIRIGLLVSASLIFYATWNVPLVSLIVLSALVDYSAALGLSRTASAGRRRLLLISSLAFNLGILATFKYANFAIESVRALLGSESGGAVLEILLPPGISFYTFQSMSYTIDVYRRRLEPTRSFGSFLLYVSFFPQLIAGPIERAARLLPQIEALVRRPAINYANIVTGFELIVWGLFKKVVLADSFGRIVDTIYARGGAYDDWSYIVATYAFALQIYCDFSAYSEIAKGTAKLFGIDLMWNFNQPYLSRSAGEFWRRWHISLSEWIRDYVYIPLGGNRRGPTRTLANLGITMFLSGLWHGAAWNFVLWGLYHGLLLLVDVQLERLPGYKALRGKLGRFWPAISRFGTFHAILMGWILFRIESISELPGVFLAFLRAPFGGVMPSVEQAGILGVVAVFLFATVLDDRYGLMRRIRGESRFSIPFHACVIVLCLVLGSKGTTPFIYFQF